MQNPAEPAAAVAVQRARSLIGLEEDHESVMSGTGEPQGNAQTNFRTNNLPNVVPNEQYVADSTQGWNDPNSLINRTGRWSPRLTYGLWIEPDRHIQVNSPFPDIISFLKEGSATFAGALFWRSMAISFAVGSALIRQHRSGGQQPRMLGNNILELPFRVDSADIVLKRVEARLSFHKHGTIEVNHPGRDQDGAIRLNHKIKTLLIENGVQVQDFLDVREVEKYLRHRFGLSSFARLEDGLKQHEGGTAARFVGRLVDELAPRAVCLGDGPRFRLRTLIEVANNVSSDLGQPIFTGPYQSKQDA